MERLNIKYIDQINAFHGWLLTNPIPASARIVWFSLIHFCNKTGWKAEFNLAMSALETDTGLSRRTIERARSILQESGLIRVKARAGNQSPIYKIIPFVRQYDAQAVAQTDAQTVIDGHDDAQSVAQSVAQSDHIPRHKDIKTKEDGDEGERARANPETWSTVLSAYQNNIHPVASPIERDRLVDLVNDYGAEWTMEAIKVAALARASTIRYVEAVLRRWSTTGNPHPWEDKPDPSPRVRTPRHSKKEAIDVVNRLMAEYQAKEGEEKDDNGSIDPASDWSFATGVQK